MLNHLRDPRVMVGGDKGSHSVSYTFWEHFCTTQQSHQHTHPVLKARWIHSTAFELRAMPSFPASLLQV